MLCFRTGEARYLKSLIQMYLPAGPKFIHKEGVIYVLLILQITHACISLE